MGTGYRIVRNKLRSESSPITESLPFGLLQDIVVALFPPAEGEGFHPPRGIGGAPPLPDAAEEEDGALIPEVTEMELAGAVGRMRTKNAAPGPNGIPGRVWALAKRPRSETQAVVQQLPEPRPVPPLVENRAGGRFKEGGAPRGVTLRVSPHMPPR